MAVHQNSMLNQFAANCINKPVLAGPVDATAIGNIMMQLLGLGEIETTGEIRMIA